VRALFAAFGLLAACVAGAQPLEHEVKAAFLYKFLSFVEWPAQSFARADAPLVIGVLAADEVHASLEQAVQGRQAQNRPVQVRRVAAGERLSGLHVLFVGRAAAASLARLAAPPGVLVVAEADGALEQGAMINFLRSDGRVRFEVAPETAERRGLRISSRMLAVAHSVKPGRP
jgi:hypothetical protein